MPKKDGEMTYKLSTILKNTINWEDLKYNRELYINSIDKIISVDDFIIKDLKIMNPVACLKNYLEELYNKKWK